MFIIESYKCYTLSTSIRKIHPVSHVSHTIWRWIAHNINANLPAIITVSLLSGALAKPIVLD